ncbi:hypothetical protein ABZ609_28645 [Streptomyces rubiginosohelvolus]|uniref:hypothetical protein n=1 Tax=Streptomyces rubiginosohelvolus TaxID=67362 RepID=UPI0033F6B7DF
MLTVFSGKIPAWIVQIPAASVESTSILATSVRVIGAPSWPADHPGAASHCCVIRNLLRASCAFALAAPLTTAAPAAASASAAPVAPVRAAAMLPPDAVGRLTGAVEDRTGYDRYAFKHRKPRVGRRPARSSARSPPPPVLAYSR